MKRNYALITAISFILFMSRGIIGPLGSVYTRSLGASYIAIGALSTVTSLMSVVFAYFWGRASDLAQRRKSFL
ncbi:MAG: hypothetical protein H5T70_04825, partial [Chloroflexi bacterium]|nr:hypothetical protein [Chloroflexota bacterium]